MKKKLLVVISIVFMLSTLISVVPPLNARSNNISERLENTIVLFIGSMVANVNNREVNIDSGDTTVPFIENGSTLVPLKFISENLGASVEWDGDNNQAIVTKDSSIIKFKIGSKIMSVNGKDYPLDNTIRLVNSRTYVPLRKFVEALGKSVFYDRGLIIVGDREDIFDKNSEKDLIDKVIERVNIPPSVGSFENLKKMIKPSDDVLAIEDNKENSGSLSIGDYSTTNVQVDGVDEADVVKTDGEYIYKINKKDIIILKVCPENEMKIIKTITFSQEKFVPTELYIDNKHMVVIGNKYNEFILKDDEIPIDDKSEKTENMIGIPTSRCTTTKAILYDISDKSDIKNIRQVEIEGRYVSSRKIGNSLYLVSNRHIPYYRLLENFTKPCYRDTTLGNDYIPVEYSMIRYFPGVIQPSYMIIGALDIEEQDQSMQISTYLGASENIYTSLNNIYTTVTYYKTFDQNTGEMLNQPYRATLIYKFALGKNKVEFKSRGDVPGNILNQFSMDESNNYFRIATTDNASLKGTGLTNNLYILDQNLNVTGKIENIAPDEKIYSVRFIGDKGYMVTFKTVDPLFVLDLKDPTNPAILGQLKIPGYSDYLHPYDENHIIGFGKDAEEINGNAYHKGMKIALFDVTDVTNPIQKFSQTIGDRGTYSQLLTNHKALLFSKAKNILAFPINVMKVDGSQYDENGYLKDGRLEFQGVYVYNLDLENGFKLKGKITHMNDEELKKMNDYYIVERILYIGNNLYTLSNGTVKVNDMSSLEEVGSLDLN